MNLPKTAYILLWFPKPSETFVFGEVIDLWRMGLPLTVFTLYGKLRSGLSKHMDGVSNQVERLGLPFLRGAFQDVRYWWRRDRGLLRKVLRRSLFQRWRGLEKTGESLWAVLCAFHLARRFEQEGIEHIHASWASGPATAAWVASMLTGIPFSFSARAWDIRPPDGALAAKTHDAAFVRCDSKHNLDYMAGFAGGNAAKVHLVYNGMNVEHEREAPVAMTPPYKLLAIGRLVEKKGFDYLIRSCQTLEQSGLDFHLHLVGDGPLRVPLSRLARSLGIDHRVSFHGQVPHDKVSELIRSADVFLMPSRVTASGDSDGLPTVISEAFIHRVPVIATDVGGISDVVEDGVTGLLIAQKDSGSIARAIIRMVGDRELALQMAEKGRERVRELYDSERNHHAMLKLIQEHSAPASKGASASG